MTVPLYSMTDSWNAGATVFTGLQFNIANTASAAGSEIFDFQIGSASVFTLRKDGLFSLFGTTNYAQRFDLYQNWDGIGTNYERLSIYTDTGHSDTLVIETQKLGTGTQRQLRLCGSNGIFLWDPAFGGAGWTFVNAGGNVSLFQSDVISLDNNSGDTTLSRGSAGVFKFASANSFSANASVATVLGSVGPVGSHTSVQNWLTVQDNGGNVRYIPCF